MKKVLAIVLSVAMLLSVFSVNVFAEKTELFSDPNGEDFLDEEWGQWNEKEGKYTFAPNDFFGTGNFWNRKAANILDITVDQVKELAKQDGVIFKYVFSGDTSGWWNDGASLTFDWSGPKAVVKITDIGGGKYEGTASLDELVDAWEANGKSIDQITALLIQVGYENFKLYSAEIITAPEEQGKVRIGDRYFDTLVDAVDAAKDGDTIYLLEDMEGAGIGIFAADGDVKDFTIDFGGFTYTCVGPAVGSPGTQSQAFHLEKGADYTPNVTFKNGTITAETGKNVKMLIQNYCNLTLTNMNLKGTKDTKYVLSNNFGNTVIDGNTSITATAGKVAFDVCYANGPYADGVSVTLDTTGTITGDIELGVWNAAGGSNLAPDINDYLEKANLTINNVKLDGEIKNNVGGFNDYEPDNAGGTDEENKAEYNEKLQKAIDINGGTFAAGSKVENYLPEGGYKTDAAGNIIVGKKNDSNRITGCVYLNEDYHALIVNGRFIAQPHVDNGTGFCVACKGAINK